MKGHTQVVCSVKVPECLCLFTMKLEGNRKISLILKYILIVIQITFHCSKTEQFWSHLAKHLCLERGF